MSTRSSVGTIDADGNYKGRYIHSDGYPTAKGDDLVQILARHDGALEYVLKVLTQDHYGWSYLNPAEGDDESTLPHGNTVQGFGRAYTDQDEDDWVTPSSDWGTEWAYGFTSTDPTTAELVVFKVKWNGGDADATFVEVERVPVKLFGQAGKINWSKIEEKGRFGE